MTGYLLGISLVLGLHVGCAQECLTTMIGEEFLWVRRLLCTLARWLTCVIQFSHLNLHARKTLVWNNLTFGQVGDEQKL